MTLKEMIKALEAKLKALQAGNEKGYKNPEEIAKANGEITAVMLEMAKIFELLGEEAEKTAGEDGELVQVEIESIKTQMGETVKTIQKMAANIKAANPESTVSKFARHMKAIQAGDVETLKELKVLNTKNEPGSEGFTVSKEVVKAGVGATNGGYFIEPELSDQVFMDSMEYTNIGPLLTHIPMRTTVMSWKHFDYASMEATWFTEDTNIQRHAYTEKGEANFNDRIVLKAYTCAAFHTYFDLFQDDLQFNIKIATLMLEAFKEWRAGELERLVINGKGGAIDPFKGLLADEDMNNRTSRSVYITGANAYSVTDKEWKKLRKSLKKAYRKKAVLVIHPTVVEAYSYKKDELGHPFVVSLDGKTTIFGMKVVESDEMPDIDEIEAGAPIAWFGSLKNCLYGTLSGLEIRTYDSHVRNLEEGEVATRFRERFGIRWVNPHHGSFLRRRA